MMDLTSAQYIQLIVALALVIIAFVGAYMGPERAVITVLILLLPFQPIASRFGTVNTGLALLVFAAFFLNGRVRRFPMLLLAGAVMLAYVVSFTQVHRATYSDHLYYLVAMGANFSLFYLVYNHVRRTGDVRGFFNILLWLNILFDIYCLAQLLVGVNPEAIIGKGDLSLQVNRADARLAGPFAAVGMTAEYLVIQVLLLLHMYMHEPRKAKKYLLVGVMMANLAFLVATGNRGGFLVLIGGGILYLIWFRREFGLGPLLVRATAGAIMLAVMSVVVVSFTEFGVLFDRLQGTQVKERVPDTRAVIWPLAWDRRLDAPVIGHGPRIRLIDEELRRIPGHEFMPYPHSGYLFVLYTIGFVGLMAWFVFFFALFRQYRRARYNLHPDPFIARLPKVAILILVVFFVDQIKVAMFRFNLSDYQQIMFVLFGGLLGAAWVAMHPPPSNNQ